MDTLETIRTIRSVRDFDSRPVPDEIATRILNAGRWSGSSKNTQPWQFILVRDQNVLVELSKCGKYAQHLARANFGIVLLTETERRAEYDAGRCSQNMMLAAWSDGVGSCIASMHQADEARRVLGVPDNYVISQVISFGYPAPGTQHPPRAGGRVALDSILHHDRW